MKYVETMVFVLQNNSDLEHAIKERRTRYSVLDAGRIGEAQGLPKLTGNQLYLIDSNNMLYRAHIAREGNTFALNIFDIDYHWKSEQLRIVYNTIIRGIRCPYKGEPMVPRQPYFFSVYRQCGNSSVWLSDFFEFSDAMDFCRNKRRESSTIVDIIV